jgi:phage terminase large subunit
MRYSRRKKKKKPEEQVLEAIKDPVEFAELLLGQDLWSKQREILESVGRHPRTAVKACHASGKTFTAASVVLWWITHRRDAIAITTAPTWTQVEEVLWKEIRSAVRGACISYPKPTASCLNLGPGRYAMGLATNEGVRFQGFHGSVLVVLDEAPGIRPEIWEAIESLRAGGDVRVLALGNPTVASGPFYEAFADQRTGWNTITISAFDTPNLEGLTVESLATLPAEELGGEVHPYLTSRRWVREKYAEWGPGHPLWQARVLGQFPQQGDGALISLAWLEAAQRRVVAVPEDTALDAGVDVAEGGENETVLVVCQGGQIVEKRAWAKADPRGEVAAALRPYRERLRRVNVDKVGVGAYFTKHLQDLGYPVYGINVGVAARHSQRFANLKAELYWGLRERFELGEIGGLDDKAVGQLAAVRYDLNARGQVVIESKEAMRKRGVKSPDHAEAILLAFAEPPGCWPRELLYEARAGQVVGAENRVRELGEAQKREVGWPVASGRKPKCVVQEPESCPQCGNPELSRYTDSWMCGACRAAGAWERRESAPEEPLR